jgi:peptidase E
LSPFTVGGDTFREMIDYYRQRYNEEIKAEISQGVEYDGNNDGSISRSETHKHRQDRIYR